MNRSRQSAANRARPSRSLRLLAPILLLLFASCSSSDSVITVGSKNFTENLLLGELIAQHIEANSELTVDRRLNLGGTFLCHEALRTGSIDIYPEYTGTALTAILELPVRQNSDEVYETVQTTYRERFNLEWLKPFGFNNTFAVVVRSGDAEQNQLQTISDLAAVARDRIIGFNFEFLERQDGYQGFIDTYDLSFKGQPKTMDLGLLYVGLKDRQIDVAVGSSTDGLISAMKLRILRDDRNYFPPYDAAAVARLEMLERHPEVRSLVNQLAGLFSEKDMQQLNYQIDGEHRPVDEVVRELRESKGL